MIGSLFENYIISEVYKQQLHTRSNRDLYYYRTSCGSIEVDLVIDHGKNLEFIEIKQGETYRPKMIKSIQLIMNQDDKGFLVYNGETLAISPEVRVINYRDYLEKLQSI